MGEEKKCNHCWHMSTIQHAIINHECQICCHCGELKCINYQTKIPNGHGEYYPERVRVRVEDTDNE